MNSMVVQITRNADIPRINNKKGLLCMKIEVNGESKYYTFRTPHIEYPDQLAVHYRADKQFVISYLCKFMPIVYAFCVIVAFSASMKDFIEIVNDKTN